MRQDHIDDYLGPGQNLHDQLKATATAWIITFTEQTSDVPDPATVGCIVGAFVRELQVILASTGGPTDPRAMEKFREGFSIGHATADRGEFVAILRAGGTP